MTNIVSFHNDKTNLRVYKALARKLDKEIGLDGALVAYMETLISCKPKEDFKFYGSSIGEAKHYAYSTDEHPVLELHEAKINLFATHTNRLTTLRDGKVRESDIAVSYKVSAFSEVGDPILSLEDSKMYIKNILITVRELNRVTLTRAAIDFVDLVCVALNELEKGFVYSSHEYEHNVSLKLTLTNGKRTVYISIWLDDLIKLAVAL